MATALPKDGVVLYTIGPQLQREKAVADTGRFQQALLATCIPMKVLGTVFNGSMLEHNDVYVMSKLIYTLDEYY